MERPGQIPVQYMPALLGSVAVLGSDTRADSSPSSSFPALYWDRRLGGSRALGWAGAVPSVMAGACQTPYGGKDLSTTEAPMVQGSSPSKICLCLPGSALPARPSARDEPPECDGTRRDSPAGEVPPLGMHQGPPCPQAPKAVPAALGKARLWHTRDPSLTAAAKLSHRILALAWHCKAGGLPRE